MTHVELALAVADLVKDRDSEVGVQDVLLELAVQGGPDALKDIQGRHGRAKWEMALELVYYWELEERMASEYYKE